MQVVSLEEMETKPVRKRATAVRRAAKTHVAEPEPDPIVVRRTVVPLPATSGFEDDAKFRGVTAAMDKVLDALHRDGWSLDRVYREPLAVLPLPVGKFPPGRVYLFTENVAVVVNRDTGSVIASLPAHAALKTLNQYTPEVLDADEWASARWESFLESAGDEEIELSPRYQKQSWFDRDGCIWTVKRVPEGARILKDGIQVHVVADDVEAEELDLHPIVVEFVAYVLDRD